jgi:hypothetical protein
MREFISSQNKLEEEKTITFVKKTIILRKRVEE